MITIPMATNWSICTPNLYRFLENEYIEDFFNDGSLRISSFSQFQKHENEQKLDAREGKTMFISRTSQQGGQTLTSWATHGINAYILSTTMLYDEDLLRQFGYDSYFKITNSTNFGMAIARQIPGVISCFEGPCLYQEKKIIEKDLGYIDINRFKDPKSGKVSKPALENFINSKMQHYPLFLKDKSYAHQVEYRYVWVVKEKSGDYLDIKAADASKFCVKPNQLTD